MPSLLLLPAVLGRRTGRSIALFGASISHSDENYDGDDEQGGQEGGYG
jgi:hypothetical protein